MPENNPYSKPDFYAKKAKEEGYNARSVYKLKEIDEKYHLLKKGQLVLDLGAFPGSWSKYALEKVGTKGAVIGIDIQGDVGSLGGNFEFIKGDIEKHQELLIKKGPYDCILSDMAPNTSGVKSQDTFLSHDLSYIALNMAKVALKKEGFFICKIFQGEDIDDFYRELKTIFKRFKSIKPKAVRKNSKEIYVLAWELREENLKNSLI